MSGCRLPVAGSAPGPRPDGAGGVPLVSRAELNRSEPRSRHPESQVLGARRAEALLAPAPRWAGQTGGTRANPAVYASERHGLAETEHDRLGTCLPGMGGPLSSAETTTLREGQSAPSVATCSSFQRCREPGPRRRRREQVALPAPSQRTQAPRKRACTELMRLSSQSPLHRDCSLRC